MPSSLKTSAKINTVTYSLMGATLQLSRANLADFVYFLAIARHQSFQNLLVEIVEATVQDYDRVMSVNLRSVWSCMKFELQHMRKQGSGTIGNGSSLADQMVAAGQC